MLSSSSYRYSVSRPVRPNRRRASSLPTLHRFEVSPTDRFDGELPGAGEPAQQSIGPTVGTETHPIGTQKESRRRLKERERSNLSEAFMLRTIGGVRTSGEGDAAIPGQAEGGAEGAEETAGQEVTQQEDTTMWTCGLFKAALLVLITTTLTTFLGTLVATSLTMLIGERSAGAVRIGTNM